jgi:hypothetical protein
VISRFKESGGLIHWAWKLGMEGRDYREVRQGAADAGTLAHRMVEADIRGLPLPVPPTDEVGSQAAQAFANYQAWKRRIGFKVLRTEVALVSLAHRFGGRLDAVEVEGDATLLDWKTGGIYPDHLLQLAAYGLLWREAFPEIPLRGGYALLTFAKENADFAHRQFSELKDAEEEFLHLRAAYDLDKRLKARAR